MSNNQTPMAPSVPSSERLSYLFWKNVANAPLWGYRICTNPHCGASGLVELVGQSKMGGLVGIIGGHAKNIASKVRQQLKIYNTKLIFMTYPTSPIRRVGSFNSKTQKSYHKLSLLSWFLEMHVLRSTGILQITVLIMVFHTSWTTKMFIHGVKR